MPVELELRIEQLREGFAGRLARMNPLQASKLRPHGADRRDTARLPRRAPGAIRAARHLIFGDTPETPFTPNMLQRRADQAWAEAGLERLTPHSCRHSYASLMIASGVNAKALSTFMGHANIGITLDPYGHLTPGSEEAAASLLDADSRRS